MRLQFDANQDYQLAAIDSVVNLFDGQTPVENTLSVFNSAGIAASANRLDLSEEAILDNLQKVQTANGLAADSALGVLTGEIETTDGILPVRYPNFSIEMETGTGKTYVYVRTALQLAATYGMRKYMIVVPSIAIREGVLKTFEMTAAHFKKLFGNLPYRQQVYDSGDPQISKGFAGNNSVEFLIITMQAFNREANIIRQKDRDQSGGIPLIAWLQAARPILILDEPQNFKSENAEAALASLNPLFALRYSATHPPEKAFNRVYRLSPYEAYRRRLVKRIEVAGIQQVGSTSAVFMRLEGIEASAKTVKAKVRLNVMDSSGNVKEKVVTLKDDSKLESLTNLPDYRDYEVEYISRQENAVAFKGSGGVLVMGEARGEDKEAIFDAQIRYTIEEHFRKQAKMKAQGIKVLSLFFIDRVANYAAEDGVIRRLFNRAFDDLRMNYEDWRDMNAESVQGAYFARKGKAGDGEYEDSTSGDADKDRLAYDLIMRDKETLLTFAAPDDDDETQRKRQVCFLFSHSALREGWDNPNVFQICTLSHTQSPIRKRQEIGRGVRLCVNQQGERIRDDRLNVLTVIANQSYEAYISTLQSELDKDYGVSEMPPAPVNARERVQVQLNKQIYELSKDFKDLWEQIKQKTRYAVRVDTKTMLDAAVQALNAESIAPPRVTVAVSEVDVSDTEESFVGYVKRTERTVSRQSADGNALNLVDTMQHMLQFTNPPVRLTRQSLLAVFQRLDPERQQEALVNPQAFASLAVRTIRAKLADQLVDGIRYHKINGDVYEMTRFEGEIESWKEYLVPAEKSVYDHVIVESEIERQFVNDLENEYKKIVLAYVKLPSWFTVPTPIGNYTPDWAIVTKDTPSSVKHLYFVSETKSTLNLDELRPDEARKIKCGKAHFQGALGLRFKHVTSVKELFDKPS
jgi:type III restriction enzyme